MDPVLVDLDVLPQQGTHLLLVHHQVQRLRDCFISLPQLCGPELFIGERTRVRVDVAYLLNVVDQNHNVPSLSKLSGQREQRIEAQLVGDQDEFVGCILDGGAGVDDYVAHCHLGVVVGGHQGHGLGEFRGFPRVFVDDVEHAVPDVVGEQADIGRVDRSVGRVEEGKDVVVVSEGFVADGAFAEWEVVDFEVVSEDSQKKRQHSWQEGETSQREEHCGEDEWSMHSEALIAILKDPEDGVETQEVEWGKGDEEGQTGCEAEEVLEKEEFEGVPVGGNGSRPH